MAKFITPITFRGTKEDKVFEKGTEIEMTVARSEEIKKNIKDNFKIDFDFTRVDEPKNKAADTKKEEDKTKEDKK